MNKKTAAASKTKKASQKSKTAMLHERLKKLGACTEAQTFAQDGKYTGDVRGLLKAWKACDNQSWRGWLLSEIMPAMPKAMSEKMKGVRGVCSSLTCWSCVVEKNIAGATLTRLLAAAWRKKFRIRAAVR